jgi:hypothetical protein
MAEPALSRIAEQVERDLAANAKLVRRVPAGDVAKDEEVRARAVESVCS